jgi:hypothetical protein
VQRTLELDHTAIWMIWIVSIRTPDTSSSSWGAYMLVPCGQTILNVPMNDYQRVGDDPLGTQPHISAPSR